MLTLRMITDIDECRTGIHTCVSTESECVNIKGDYVCRCDRGYVKGATDKQCIGTYIYHHVDVLRVTTCIFKFITWIPHV